jgi:hypothetical protein
MNPPGTSSKVLRISLRADRWRQSPRTRKATAVGALVSLPPSHRQGSFLCALGLAAAQFRVPFGDTLTLATWVWQHRRPVNNRVGFAKLIELATIAIETWLIHDARGCGPVDISAVSGFAFSDRDSAAGGWHCVAQEIVEEFSRGFHFKPVRSFCGNHLLRKCLAFDVPRCERGARYHLASGFHCARRRGYRIDGQCRLV